MLQDARSVQSRISANTNFSSSTGFLQVQFTSDSINPSSGYSGGGRGFEATWSVPEIKECFACGAGKYINVTGATTCALCEPGKAQNASGASTCVDCVAGKYTAGAGAAACTNCEASKYKATAGANTPCDNCVAGKFSTVVGATAVDTCVDCAAGKYKADAGAAACTDCGAGKYKSAAGVNTACDDCEAGKYKSPPVATLTCGARLIRNGEWISTTLLTASEAALNCGGGCTPSSGATSGNFSDGPGNYVKPANCWWKIDSPGSEIQISFSSFDTVAKWDSDILGFKDPGR
jgi:hypothetical protein